MGKKWTVVCKNSDCRKVFTFSEIDLNHARQVTNDPEIFPKPQFLRRTEMRRCPHCHSSMEYRRSDLKLAA
jgi:hypothetical protein